MQIYLARNNQQAGPYSLEQINQMLASQQVLLTDLAWHQGMNEWKALGELTQGKLVYEPTGATPAATPPFQPNTQTAQATPNTAHRSSEIKQNAGALPLASLGTRFFAKVLDLLLWLPAAFIPYLLLGVDSRLQLLEIQGKYLTVTDTAQALQLQTELVHLLFTQEAFIGMSVYIVLMLAVQAFLLFKTGQSIGKKMLGLKIVDAETNGKASLNQVFILRSLVFIILNISLMVLNLMPFIAVIDIVFAFNPQRQTLHDKLAKTKVVKP